MVCTSSSPTSVHRDWRQNSEDDEEWPAPLYLDDDDGDGDVWIPHLDPSIINDRNGHGHGEQAKIDYISYLIARSPHIGCCFCAIEDVSVIEDSIPIWTLQVMQPRPEGLIWEDKDAWPAEPDGLGHICLGCYKRVLELQLERPDWDSDKGNGFNGIGESAVGNGWEAPVRVEDDGSFWDMECEPVTQDEKE